MSRITTVVLGGLVATALAGCSAADGDAAGVDAQPSPTLESATDDAPSAAPEMLTEFSDTFDDDRNGWALPATEIASSEMVGGDFVLETKAPLRPHMMAATLADAFDGGRLDMTDVVVRTSVTVERGSPALGLFCREVPDVDGDFQWYEFVVRDGYAAIRLGDMAGNLDVLAKTEQVHVAPEKAIKLEASCVDESDGTAALGLKVDGRPVLTADVNDPLGNGGAGIQSYDPPDAQGGSLSAWHDFSVGPAR